MGEGWAVSAARLAVAAGLIGLLGGCFGYPDLDSPQALAPGPGVSPERAAAIAEMRAEASAGDDLPYPKVYQRERTLRLAERSEPLAVREVEEIKAEMTTIAAARAVATDPNEIAALDQRAEELRQLIQARHDNRLRP